MVPAPLPFTPPIHPGMGKDLTVCLPSDKPVEPIPFIRNTSGRPWKQPHMATVRAQKSDKSSSNWDKRLIARKKDEGVRKLEKDMKDEKTAEVERKKAITKERKLKAAEKLRLEEMATRMSARKLQRMKKRMGRTPKVSA